MVFEPRTRAVVSCFNESLRYDVRESTQEDLDHTKWKELDPDQNKDIKNLKR